MEATAEKTTWIQKIRYSFELVKFSHTLFAMPFALAAFLVASRGSITLGLLFKVILCLFLARTAAMAFNRLVDARFDALNPRTQNRHLPAGQLSKSYVLALTLLCSGGFIAVASRINSATFWLSPICLALLFFYSLTKRFTHFTQIFLGLSLGMAPVAAYVAVKGAIVPVSLLLGTAVLFWVAGFDLLYSLQDMDFDRQQGLHSLAAKCGKEKSLWLARLFHLLFLVFLAAYGWKESLGHFFWISLLFSGVVLAWEHLILRKDLSRINAAFFTANGLLSLAFFGFIVADLYLPQVL